MEVDVGEEHKSKLEDYEVIEQIGRCMFGSAFLIIHKSDDNKYVMKRFRLAKQTEKFKQGACSELSLMAKLNNPYIVQYKDCWVGKDNDIYIVTAYCERGNMYDAIREAKGKLFPEEKLFKWLVQLLLAVDYLHSKRVLHRDLKCSSISLTEDDDIQLGDFGLAKFIYPEKLASSGSGTPNSMCPEILEKIPYGYKSDIWALGCCMFEIMAHQPAFKAPDMAGLINKINRSIMTPLPIVYSSNLKQIIKAMLRKKQEHRPTAAELLRNPCLQPYLLQCKNPSSVYLPVFPLKPVNSPKEKARRRSLPGKIGNQKEYKETKGEVARSLDNLFSFQTNPEARSSNSSHSEIPASASSVEEKLETKRIDPTFCTSKISESTEYSANDRMADSDIIMYTSEMKAELVVSTFAKEAETLLSEDSSLLHEVDVKVVSDKDGPLSEQTFEVEGTMIPFPGDRDLETNGKTSFESDETENISSRDSGTDKDRASGGKANTGIIMSAMEVKDEDAKVMNLTESDMSLLSKLTMLGGNGSPKHGRADALESLLELCARLLRQEKYDELAGVLQPFGEETVSSRETAIWLTKSLLSAHNFKEGT